MLFYYHKLDKTVRKILPSILLLLLYTPSVVDVPFRHASGVRTLVVRGSILCRLAARRFNTILLFITRIISPRGDGLGDFFRLWPGHLYPLARRKCIYRVDVSRSVDRWSVVVCVKKNRHAPTPPKSVFWKRENQHVARFIAIFLLPLSRVKVRRFGLISTNHTVYWVCRVACTSTKTWCTCDKHYQFC